MTTNQMSLFVPHMRTTITKEKIASVFAHFGEIDKIDLVPKKTDGKPHNVAYIHFKNWRDTDENREFQQKLTTGAMKAHLAYDDKWYWIVLENKKVLNTLPSSPLTPFLIQNAHFPEENGAVMSENGPVTLRISNAQRCKTPPRPNKPLVMPGAPKRPQKTQNARISDDEKHIAQDLFGEDMSDMVDATYVYYMEQENLRLREQILAMQYNMQFWSPMY
jgi:hypothetical protein